MEINVQSIHFDADSKLLDFIEKKVSKLDHYFDQILKADIYLKLEHTIKETNKVFEIKLAIPGNDLFCKEHAPTFEAATDLAMECVKSQLSKHKERVRNHNSNHKQTISDGESF
ncbi:MAG: ribosome-associated translation inhibitor RaiA [Bacteroidota bacterium]|jgi:putative sigma-54 modulation protein